MQRALNNNSQYLCYCAEWKRKCFWTAIVSRSRKACLQANIIELFIHSLLNREAAQAKWVSVCIRINGEWERSEKRLIWCVCELDGVIRIQFEFRTKLLCVEKLNQGISNYTHSSRPCVFVLRDMSIECDPRPIWL